MTNFDYPYNHSTIKEFANKKMIIILDNADEFFVNSMEEFTEELDTLKKEFVFIKIILTCKEKNISAL